MFIGVFWSKWCRMNNTDEVKLLFLKFKNIDESMRMQEKTTVSDKVVWITVSGMDKTEYFIIIFRRI